MGFIFKTFKIIGIDLSKYNDNPDTPRVVDPQKVVDTGIDFTAMRSTVGKWLDPKFKQFWAALRGFVLRIQYHYMDYYSHGGLGLTAEQWGEVQAQAVYDSTKDDNDGCPAFLDIEKASFAAKIEDVLPLVQSIAKAFLVKLDALNGKKNGLYLSLSYIKYFLFAKDRPLWLALYNEYYTPAQAIALARSRGWTGPIYMWQYASDGDIDDDGVADGLKIGVESRTVDLNIWVESQDAFDNFGKKADIGQVPAEPPVVGQFMAKCTAAKSLTIRIMPDGDALVVGFLMHDEERRVYEVSDGWYRIGVGQWVWSRYMQKIAVPVEPMVIIPNLAVPSVSQNNSLWNRILLGMSTDRTIGSDGCALSGVDAAIAFLKGLVPNPAKLNQDLKNNGGFEGALIVWGAVTKIHPDIVLDEDNFIRDAALVTEARIDAVLRSGRPVIAQVDHNPSTTSLEPHWVVIKGKNSNGYVIMDTWDGATVELSSRYKKLLRMVVFSHVLAVPVEISDPEKLKKLWAAHMELH